VVGGSGGSGAGCRSGSFLFSPLPASFLSWKSADIQILGQHQLALEGLTGLLNRMEFDEGVISKGLAELGEARH
jgi:hypothetical protein